MAASPPRLGSRLAVGRHKATVRFVGPLPGRDGDWAGLEWDEPERGKHDGSLDGRRYFQCQASPTPGPSSG